LGEVEEGVVYGVDGWQMMENQELIREGFSGSAAVAVAVTAAATATVTDIHWPRRC
jgi:hypothetical protein